MLAGLIKKEWLALTRDVHGLVALFLMPVVFIITMSLALKDVYNPPLHAIPYTVIAHDQGALSQTLMTMWESQHGPPQPVPADWQAELRSGRLKYVLVLEAGLSAELAMPALPKATQIQLLAEPGIDGNLLNALRAQLMGAAGELKARTLLGRNAAGSMELLVQTGRTADGGPRPTAVQQNVPAWLVFGMFFVIASLSNLLVQERSTGALARLHSLGVSTPVVLASKALPYLGVNALQAVLMLAVGVWLMPLLGGDALSLRGIRWDALGVAVGAISVASVAMGLAIASAVRTSAQASAIGPIVNIVMAAVGGIMVPKFVMPAFMQPIVALSPMNWALEALLNVVLRGGDIGSMLPDVFRLVLFAIVMSVTAYLFLRRTV